MKITDINILVAGATGKTDLQIVQHLIDQGHKPTALVCESSDTSALPEGTSVRRGETLLHKLADGRTPPVPGQTHPTASVNCAGARSMDGPMIMAFSCISSTPGSRPRTPTSKASTGDTARNA